MGITLEKVDKVKERTGATYAEAKYALEVNNGDILDAIIYLEEIKGNNSEVLKTLPNIENSEKSSETVDELKVWLKDLINKGNITRIRIYKEEKEIIDVPVNAGIAAGVIAVIVPQILAFGLIAAVATQIRIELTMSDGTVEVVNKYVSKAVDDIKDVATEMASKVKNKVSGVKHDTLRQNREKNKLYDSDEKVYSYTVNFDDEE
ncbi:DUF4342 domain-containing protein [Clostridium septicum]